MIIVHRCSCGHPDIYHSTGFCFGGHCQARIHERGASEVIPTFVDGRLVEHVHKPGSSGAGYKLCACKDCMALWQQVKVDVPPLLPWHAAAS